MEANGAPYFPGAASLIDQLDTIVSLMLRDSRNLIGKLRSFDQYLNLVLEDTVERIVLSGKYCDIPLGLHLVRGDNIVMLGEVDTERENNGMGSLVKVTPEDLGNIEEELKKRESSLKTAWDFEG